MASEHTPADDTVHDLISIQYHALFKGSDADVQEQERPWESEESEEEPEQPEHIGIESPEADALEQARSWSSEDEREHPYG